MYQYFVVTITLAIVSSILFAHFLDKKGMTKKHKVMAVVFCSMSVAVLSSLFPIISGVILDITTRINEILHINLWTGFSYTVIFIVYLGGILILSVYLSTIIIGENDGKQAVPIFVLIQKLFMWKGVPALEPVTNESMKPIENSRTSNYHMSVSQGTVVVEQIVLQKPVDSEKNIDTIGIGVNDISGENPGIKGDKFEETDIGFQYLIDEDYYNEDGIEVSEDSEQTDIIEEEIEIQETSLFTHISDEINVNTINETDNFDETFDAKENSIDSLIEQAFMLKSSGDLEGAILNYMNALEHDIEDQVVFWLVLDICVLYKQLGKSDLAKDVLESYVTNYGSIMNKDVKAQIINNLC